MLVKLLEWILSRLKSPRQYRVIELEKPLPGGSDEAISSLREHPGFIALMNRLRLRRDYLKSQLLNNKHSSLRDVDIILISIAGTRYLEFEVNTAVGKLQERPKMAEMDEVIEFEKALSSIESIGSQSQI